MGLGDELTRDRERFLDQIRRLNARVAELEDALVTIKRWVDTRQFDGEACRHWVIAHVGQKKAR